MARDSFQRGSVEFKKKKGEGIWALRYRVRDANSKTGWRHRTEILPLCKTEKDAYKELSKRIGEINTQNNDPHRRVAAPSFAEFSSGLWRSYLENRGVKPSTVYSYDSMLDNHLVPEFGEMKMDEIMPVQLTTFFDKVRGKVAPKYALNLYTLLSTMFEVATEYDLIETSPVRRKLHRPKHKAKKKPALSGEQIRRVIDNAPDEYKPLLTVAVTTDLRLGEILALRWEDVDFDNLKLSITLNLWRGKLGLPKTEASATTLHLAPALADVLKVHRQKSAFTEPGDFVFCKADGTPCDPDHLRNQVLYPAIDAAGIKRSPREYGFHIFRHAAGSIVHAATGDLKQAQELLRHTRVSTTGDIYTHLTENVAKQATEILAREIICSPIVLCESEQIQ